MYIGITSASIATRWRQHRSDAIKRGISLIQRAVRKHGADNFSIEHIASAKTYEDLLELEKIIIYQRQTRAPRGYNLTDGGQGCLGMKHSQSARQKFREALLARGMPKEAIEKRSAKLRGRKVSQAEKDRRAAARKERMKDPVYREKIRTVLSRARKGKPLSDLHKQRLSEAKQSWTDEKRESVVEKIRKARTGSHLSAATKEKLRIIMKDRHFSDIHKFRISVAKRGLGMRALGYVRQRATW